MKIAHVVRGFRNSPRHTTLLTVFDLPVDDCSISFREQRRLIVSHHEQRHQILEHRAGPRNQRASTIDLCERAAHSKPVLLWNVSLRDADKACETRFGGKQIIIRIVDTRGGNVVAERKELAFDVEEK